MRSTLFLLLAFCTAVIANAQNGVDWKQLELKGKPRSVKTEQTYRYKKNGVSFTPWEKTHTQTYLFDHTGRKTEFQETKTDGGGYKVTYANKLKEKKIEVAFFDKNGNPTITKIYSLDEKGRLIALQEYTREGKADRGYTYAYDAKGNNTEMVSYKADGNLSGKTTWTYNVNGKATDWRSETPGYATTFKRFVYDDKGNMKEEIWLDGNKEQTMRFERIYDDKGNKISESTYDEKNNFLHSSTWKYEYDKTDNWIKRTQFTGQGEDFQLEERVILYF